MDEKQRKKELRAQWERKQREEFENSLPMEREFFLELFDYLDHEFSENEQDCDDSARLTQRFLTEKGLKNIPQILSWLQERGGYCDCEILANVEDFFDLG